MPSQTYAALCLLAGVVGCAHRGYARGDDLPWTPQLMIELCAFGCRLTLYRKHALRCVCRAFMAYDGAACQGQTIVAK